MTRPGPTSSGLDERRVRDARFDGWWRGTDRERLARGVAERAGGGEIPETAGHRQHRVIPQVAVALELRLVEELVGRRVVRERRIARGEVAHVHRLVARERRLDV